MSKELPSYLKLHVEPAPSLGAVSAHRYGGLDEICKAFAEVTGWELQYSANELTQAGTASRWSMPIQVAGQPRCGRLELHAPSNVDRTSDTVPETSIVQLATAVGRLLEELVTTQTTVWHREAELAAGVPVIARGDEPRKFASRLESILKAGVDAVSAAAAGLYLLDADTSELKLRSSWGLPFRRLLEPPRRLASSIADLEALSGHAVVLESRAQTRSWLVPEDVASAVCVPVSTPTVPLGTLWIFCMMERSYTDQELNVIEVVAGRLAAELERQMLLVEGQQGSQFKRQLAAARAMQQNQLPQIAPLIEGWQVAGWAMQAQELGGAFYDWLFLHPPQLDLDDRPPDANAVFYDWLTYTPKEFPAVHGGSHPGDAFREFLQGKPERFAVTAGVARGEGLPAAITAQGIRMALRAHADYTVQPDQLLARVNRGIWSGSAGDQTGMMFLATIDPESGAVDYTAAGYAVALRLSGGSWQLLDEPQLALGLEPDSIYAVQTLTLLPGDALVLLSEKLSGRIAEHGSRFGFDQLAALALSHVNDSASELAETLRIYLERRADELPVNDLAMIVVKRLPSSR